MKTLEFVAQYKMGNSVFTLRTTVAARNVQLVQEVPREDPFYLDGALSVIEMPGMGARIYSTETYESIRDRYNSLMVDEG